MEKPEKKDIGFALIFGNKDPKKICKFKKDNEIIRTVINNLIGDLFGHRSKY